MFISYSIWFYNIYIYIFTL
jgi:hypothetical protein